jgi:hypothetical protein
MSPGTKQSTEIRTDDVTVDDDIAVEIVEHPSTVLRRDGGLANRVNETARTTGARRWPCPDSYPTRSRLSQAAMCMSPAGVIFTEKRTSKPRR